jgi:murein DD-endopeptidase MepM/ murein hydrolase activator NlpD
MQEHPPERRRAIAVPRIALVAVVSGFFLLGALVAFSAADTLPAAGAGQTPAGEQASSADVSAAPVVGAVVAARPPLPAPPPLEVIEGSIRGGATLAGLLDSQGVPAATVHVISREMRPHFDFRRARPGHTYRLARDTAGELVSFDYHTSPSSGYRLLRVGDGFEIERQEVELVPRPALIAGLVTSTLYGAVVELGEQGQLARDFADVFAWDIDFQRSVRPGDAFQIVYERLHRVEQDGSETYVRPGRILAARYDGTAGRHTAVYFEVDEGRGGYYRPDGRSVEGEFLMSPLRHGRITSSFSTARRHPILKVTRPHPGIDYAAPSGTPVWAVADGEVIYRARAGGFGNLVKVRHANGYVSYYAHLSRYASGLGKGSRVEQKQVIGYVGSTGLATGPHVCFRVQKDGSYVNPARLRAGNRAAVPTSLMSTFTASRDLLLAELDGGAIVAGASSL